MGQEKGSCLGGGWGGGVFMRYTWWKCAWLLLTLHCPKLNHMAMPNAKEAGECNLAARYGDRPFIVAAVHVGTAPFLFSLSPATPQKGLTFPPCPESQFSAAESPPPPTWRTKIESWHATFWWLLQLIQSQFPVFHKDVVRINELF